MSWGGMFYDLSIPFLLLSKRLRWFGFTFSYYISFIHRIFISNWNVSLHYDFICPDFFSFDFHKNIIGYLRHLFKQFLPENSKNKSQINLRANYNSLKKNNVFNNFIDNYDTSYFSSAVYLLSR